MPRPENVDESLTCEELMTLEEFNGLEADLAERELRHCCGSRRWARGVAARGEEGDRAGEGGWGRGVVHTGRVGAWAAREQAGLDEATEDTRQRLAAANRGYEDRFGFIYIVCATGKTAGEMLAIAEGR